MYPTSIQNTNPTRKVRTIRRKKDWEVLLAEYKVSALSQKAFCQRHQLSMSSFYQWKKKLSIEPVGDPDFIDISTQLHDDSLNLVEPAKPSGYQIELELGFGIILRVRSH